MNPEETQKKPEERTPIKSLRTYQGDVQEAIQKNKYSSTTILVSEQKRKLESPVDPEKESQRNKNRNKNFILFGVAFIVLGLASISILYYIKSNEKIAVEQKTKSLIAYSTEKIIPIKDLSRSEIINTIIENKNSWDSQVNSVLYLNLQLNNAPASTENVLSNLAPKIPPSLVRSLGEKYMFGIYSFDTNEPYIILTVNDFSLAYPGMLKWENDMISDLGELFGAESNETATSTNFGIFTDLTVKNKDIRIAKDLSGRPIILYSFVDRQTLIITKNENILSALVDKIILNKQVR